MSRTNDDWESFLASRVPSILSSPPPAPPTLLPALAQVIDHTLLAPSATPSQILTLCAEAKTHSFASVCVNPLYTELAADALKDTAVRVCTVIGFPLGASSSATKAFETQLAVAQGAAEVDMVLAVGRLRAREFALVYTDIRGVVEAAAAGGALVKVIIETALLPDDADKVAACLLAAEAGATFVKTCTGFGGGAASVHDVGLMCAAVEGYGVCVKASGGVRSAEAARAMVGAGAARIGTSSGVKIVEGGVGEDVN